MGPSSSRGESGCSNDECRRGSTPARGGFDEREFAVVEPDDAAAMAGIDDDITGAVVRVDVHGKIALRTADDAIEVFRIQSDRHTIGFPESGSSQLDHGGEGLAGNQHAAAVGTVLDAAVLKDGVLKDSITNGAVPVGILAKRRNAVR